MSRINRRAFLSRSTSVAFAIPSFIPGVVLGKDGTAPSSERIRIGSIGVRNRGKNMFYTFLGYEEVTRLGKEGLRRAKEDKYQDAHIVAVADVDGEVRNTCMSHYEQRFGKPCDAYSDFRRLLDRKDIDAVCIATPDHWHSIPVIMACQAGKDIYCEKPLSHTIDEGREMVKAVRKYKRVFQTGNQQRSCPEFREACELVRSGGLGKINRIEVGLGGSPREGGGPNTEAPPTLDWNFWLGPAPLRPYNPYLHKMPHRGWRWMWDYSGGTMTNWGAHHLDIAHWAMGMDESGPLEVEGGEAVPPEGLYETYWKYNVVYRYANNVIVDCSSRHRLGVKFIGDKGTGFIARHGSLGDRVHVRSKGIVCNPPELAKGENISTPVRLYVSTNHLRNWLDCIKSRKRPICDVEIGHRSATVCHLGNIAMKLRRKLHWDPAAEQFVDDEQANQMTDKLYRKPWQLTA